MRRVGGKRHPICDEGGPPHGLLLCDGRDGAYAWADEADEGDVGVRRSDDVANRGVRGSWIGGVQEGEDLLVAGAVDDGVWADLDVLHATPVFAVGALLEDDSSCGIDARRECTSVDMASGIRVFGWVDVAVAQKGEWMFLLVGSIEVRHCSCALVEEHVGASQAVVREGTDVLIHAGLGARQEPEDALDDEVGDEPAEAAGGEGAVDVGGFEEVGDEAIDGESTFEHLAEYLEAREGFGEGEETGSKAHCCRICGGFHRLVRDVWVYWLAVLCASTVGQCTHCCFSAT